MLRLKILINYKELDEIRVQNTGEYDSRGKYVYKIVKPEGYEALTIKHDRDDGCIVLIAKVTNLLKTQGYKSS